MRSSNQKGGISPPTFRSAIWRAKARIERTTLERRSHEPTLYAGNPVLRPKKRQEVAFEPYSAMAFSDGAIFDPPDGLCKMWYRYRAHAAPRSPHPRTALSGTSQASQTDRRPARTCRSAAAIGHPLHWARSASFYNGRDAGNGLRRFAERSITRAPASLSRFRRRRQSSSRSYPTFFADWSLARQSSWMISSV